MKHLTRFRAWALSCALIALFLGGSAYVHAVGSPFATYAATGAGLASRTANGLLGSTQYGKIESTQSAKAVATKDLTGLTTYANGTAGVGATLTWTATGAPPADTWDSVTLGVNDLVVIPTGLIEAGREGLYKLTTIGAGGISQIGTRDVSADTSAKLLGLRINVSAGMRERSRSWAVASAPGSIDGTTAISVVPSTGADRSVVSDAFDDFTRIMATSGTITNGTNNTFDLGWQATVGTGGAILNNQAQNDDQLNGVVEMNCGTAATGDTNLFTNFYQQRLGDTLTEGSGLCRLKIPTLSTTGVQAFDTGCNWTAGGVFGAITDGFAAWVRGSDNHAMWTQCNASACTSTDLTGAAVAANTVYTWRWYHAAGTSSVDVTLNGVLTAGLATNFPSGAARMFPDIDIKCSAGGLATRKVYFDTYQSRHVSPKGRRG